jgi:hypothetical protein
MHLQELVPPQKGVVFLGRYFPVLDEEKLGDSTAVISQCRLFGDPEMVARICKALGEGKGPAGHSR